MKPFSLEEFKKNPSRKVVTREGNPVRIICTDAKCKWPIVALVYNGTDEDIEAYSEDGKLLNAQETRMDLFFNIEKKTGFINLYHHSIYEDVICCSNVVYETKKQAEIEADRNKDRFMTTAKVTWEE